MRSTLPGRMLRRLLVILAAALTLAASAPAQNFAQPTVIPTGNWPAAVYTADINADGIPDLICIDPGATATSSTTHVMLGDGKGSFTQSAVIATAGASVDIGDLTGDGIVDIGWLTWNGAASSNTFLNIAAGIGTGTFQATQTISFGFELAGPGSPQPTFTSLLAAPIRGQGYPMDMLAILNNNACAFAERNLLGRYQLQPQHAYRFAHRRHDPDDDVAATVRRPARLELSLRQPHREDAADLAHQHVLRPGPGRRRG